MFKRSVGATTITPIDFIDFASSGAGGGSFEIAGKTEHGDVASVLIETNHHDGVSELGAIVSTVTFIALHIIATGAKSKNICASIFVGFETFVGRLNEFDKV